MYTQEYLIGSVSLEDPDAPTPKWKIFMAFRSWEDGSELGGRESTSPWALVKGLNGLRNRANSQWYSSIYEDWKPKIVQNIEKSDGKKSA